LTFSSFFGIVTVVINDGGSASYGGSLELASTTLFSTMTLLLTTMDTTRYKGLRHPRKKTRQWRECKECTRPHYQGEEDETEDQTDANSGEVSFGQLTGLTLKQKISPSGVSTHFRSKQQRKSNQKLTK
jgi:hypothetical protein